MNMSAFLLPLLLFILGSKSSAQAQPRLPVLYLQEPGGRLELDPRVQRETPAFYDAEPELDQRDIPGGHDLDSYQNPDASEPDRYLREVQDEYEPDRYQRGVQDSYEPDRYQRKAPGVYDAAHRQREASDSYDQARQLREVLDSYDPARQQFEVPDSYHVDRYQRKVPDVYEPDRLKRKSPLSFLFFEKDGGSAGQIADRVSRNEESDGQGDIYNGTGCVNSACNSSCLVSSAKRGGGRCRGGRCVCGERTYKKRFGNKMIKNNNYTKANKTYKKLTR